MVATTNKYPEGATDRNSKIDAQFDNGFVRTGIPYQNFLLGAVKDGEVWSREKILQTTFHSGCWGDAVVTHIHNMKNLTIKFLDTSNEQVEPFDPLVKGLVVDRKAEAYGVSKRKVSAEEGTQRRLLREAAALARWEKQQQINKERRKAAEAARANAFEKSENYKVVLAEREERNNLNIQEAVTPKSVVIQDRDVAGTLEVDFKDREGKWVLRYKRGDFIQTRLGKMHNNMTQRARKDGSYQGVNSSYEGVSVSEEFKDPQKFCDWAVQQRGWGLGFCLDKDLLIDGNREYCAEACSLLPQVINYAIIRQKKCFVKGGDGLFAVTQKVDGRTIKLGKYVTEDDARSAYCKYREKYIRKLAEEYKEFISERAYKALLEFRV